VTTIDVRDAAGKKSGSVDLPADLFDAQVNIPLIHQVVVGQLAAARQGTHDTKSRGEVSGGGRKPYRQKGTGRARQGSIRAPQFTGGGIVHGPTPHGYDHRTPKKMKAAALRGALSDRARDGRIHIVELLVDGDTPSTKSALGVLERLSMRPKALVVVDRNDVVTQLSLRNVSRVHVLVVDQLNTYDVLASDDVVFTRAAYDELVATRSTGADGGASSDDHLDEVVADVVQDADAGPGDVPAEEVVAKADEAEADQAEADQADAEQADVEQAAPERAEPTEAEQTDAVDADEAEATEGADSEEADK